MTSKRNLNARNLGPVLALTGAGIAIAAVVAGFIAVGGPGQARNERLDTATEYDLHVAIEVLHCAFESTGVAPASFEVALNTAKKKPRPTDDGPNCSHTGSTKDFKVASGVAPAVGQISYRVVAPTALQVCAHFRTARGRDHGGFYNDQGEFDIDRAYPQLQEPRPEGVRCYDIDLTKTGPIAKQLSVID